MNRFSDPILTIAQAVRVERGLFGGDETKEWPAMQRAGAAVAAAVRQDFEEIGGLPDDGRLLVLVGKGHNGGDAMIAAQVLLNRFPCLRADVVFVFGERVLRPLARRAARELAQAAGDRMTSLPASRLGGRYDLCLDGVFGFQFRPPADRATTALMVRVNALEIRLRAAVDLPSADLFRADFTYATGIAKLPVLAGDHAGRVRYLDLGFFDDSAAGKERVLKPSCLDSLAGLRPANSDKRTHGHLLVLGGSLHYPGAILMTVLSALRSGVGLLTAFVPESLVPAYAAAAPEAMWVGWPETSDGGLAQEGIHLLRSRLEKAAAMVIGPGLGRETDTLALIKEIVSTVKVPVVLDADALQPEIVAARKGPLIVTPHAGEFARIAAETIATSKTKFDLSDDDTRARSYRLLRTVARKANATVVLKGPVTRITDGGEIYHSFVGGPVLGRGGSGDILAGLVGGMLAQAPRDLNAAACRAVVWHGLAADHLARAKGQTAVRTTELIEHLASALRADGAATPSSRLTEEV